MDKTCKVCNFTGAANLFVKNRRLCKKCYSNIQAQYRAATDKKEVAEYQREYRQSNFETLKEQKKEYYESNKEFILEQQKVYYQDNSDIIKTRNVNYRQIHKSERNARDKERRDTDPAYKLRVYLSRDIYRSVKSKGGLSTLDILSYSVAELRAHLEVQFEPWMNWQNHGRYNTKTWNDSDSTTWTWQIDHIIPRSRFNHTNIDSASFIECWSLSNLRPLSSKTNLVNGSKLKRREK